MTRTKRGRAINGDLFSLTHPSLSLDAPFTTFTDVAYRGVTYQVLAAADRNAFSYATTTGEFTVGGLRGHVIQTIDTVETQAAARHQALVASEVGVLSVHSYGSVDSLLSLVGALRPQETRLGLTIDPDDEIEFTTAPRVALQLELGVVELTPLTLEVNELLPTWEGTRVTGGQLYGGRLTDDAPYLTLVTETCRLMVLPADGIHEDRLATTAAGFGATWAT